MPLMSKLAKQILVFQHHYLSLKVIFPLLAE